jgi:prevent-host-death family protein
MRSVGVRELRQRASELLRLVAGGETIEVTDRGRPVAVLAPVPGGSPLERLRASGEVLAGEGDFDDLPDPLPVPAGQEPPSAVLERLRHDER